MKTTSPLAPDYLRFVAELKDRVRAARLAAARAVNRDLILLYWDIGRAIVEKQRQFFVEHTPAEFVAQAVREIE